MANTAGSTLQLVNATVTGNSSARSVGGIGGGAGGTVTAINSIILGNTDQTGLGGATAEINGFTVGANNLITGDVATVFAAVDGATGGGQLADNGGPVQTIALLGGGAAIDAGDETQLVEATIGFDLNGDGDTDDTITTDATGAARVQGANVDLGAVEAEFIVPAIPVSDGDDFAVGTSGNDTIDAGGGSDLVLAGDGNDSVGGGEGIDALGGEGGNDTLEGGGGTDLVLAGDGNDSVGGGEGVDALAGEAGNDTLDGGSGNDILSGGEGDDLIYGGDDDDFMAGGTGADSFFGGDGNDTVTYATSATGVTINLAQGFRNTGEAAGDVFDSVEQIIGSSTGSNTITGDAGSNTLVGGDEADRLNGGAGNDTLEGGGGDDHYTIDSLDDVVIEDADGGFDRVLAEFSFTLTDNVEGGNLLGTDDLTLTGNELNNWLQGNSGNNSLIGLDGNDRLEGNDGNDTLLGGEGNDNLEGGAGNDIFVIETNAGIDSIRDFTQGEDLIDLTGVPATFDDLSIVQIGSDTHIVHPEGRIVLNNFTATDLSPDDFLSLRLGTEGNDNLTVINGPVRIEGLDGDDLLRSFNGAATLEGGTGDDAYFVYEAGTIIIEQADEGTDRVYAAIDHTLDDHIEFGNVQGTDSVDLIGNELDNRLRGNEATNELSGGAGSDLIRGQGGDDTINGGTGNDRLAGGDDADRFVFSDAGDLDRVTDFEDGIDTLAIEGFFVGFADLVITDTTGGALVDFGSGQILVEGTTASQLGEADFDFVPPVLL